MDKNKDKDIVNTEGGFKEATLNWLGHRFGPLYITYIISFTVWNWKFLYALFVSDELSGIEYAITFFPDALSNIENARWHMDILLWIFREVWVFGIPALIAWIVIKYLPVLVNWSYRISIENINKRRIIEIQENAEFQKQEKIELDILVEGIIETTATVRKQEKAIKEGTEAKEKIEETKESVWEKEYQKLKKTKHFQHDFWIIKELILSYNGQTNYLGEIIGPGAATSIAKDNIFLLFSKDILTRDKNIIGLTGKGNYILSRYIEDIQNDGAKKHGYKISRIQ